MSTTRLALVALLVVVSLGLGYAAVTGLGARSIDDSAVSVREGSPGAIGVRGGGPRTGK